MVILCKALSKSRIHDTHIYHSTVYVLKIFQVKQMKRMAEKEAVTFTLRLVS